MTWRGAIWQYLRLLAHSVVALRYKPRGGTPNHDGIMTYTVRVKVKSLVTSALKTDCDYEPNVSV